LFIHGCEFLINVYLIISEFSQKNLNMINSPDPVYNLIPFAEKK
jgi:hypothetical protein